MTFLLTTFNPTPLTLVGITNSIDYSPFGVQLDGRTISNDFYRRGFNGMEKDDEVKGGGNSYDFGARMFDARLGRFLSLDAYMSKFPNVSPYNFAGNTPVCAIDAKGDSVRIVTQYYSQMENKLVTEITVLTETMLKSKLFDLMYPGINKVLSTNIGKEYLSEFLNSSDIDVYMSYQYFESEAEGRTLFPNVTKEVLGKDKVFNLKNTKIFDQEEYSYLKGVYSVFNGIEVTAKSNYFIVIKNRVRPGFYAEIGEIVFHEFLHVFNFLHNPKMSYDDHHDAMGSEKVGNGNDKSKPIPKFREQLREVESPKENDDDEK